MERNFRVPQAGEEAPALREFPVGLRIERGAPHRVVLVAFQSASGSEIVDVAPAALLLIVVITSQREREGLAGKFGRVRPAQVQSVVETVEIDDGARRSLCILRRDRNCKELLDLPAPAVSGKPQAV